MKLSSVDFYKLKLINVPGVFQLICVKKMVCKWFRFISILTILHVYLFSNFLSLFFTHRFFYFNLYVEITESRYHLFGTKLQNCEIWLFNFIFTVESFLSFVFFNIINLIWARKTLFIMYFTFQFSNFNFEVINAL